MLSGAGISTASGLPDYRGQGQSRLESPDWESFRDNPVIRSRHWKQTLANWDRLAAAEPSSAHRRLAQWGDRGLAVGVITQNLDNLHQRAGSRPVIELHGTDAKVLCQRCGNDLSQTEFKERFEASQLDFGVAPSCDCGGLLRPGSTFFGEQIELERYRSATKLVSDSDALLVLGTSLRVNTGMQLVQLAASLERPIVLVNLGVSQGQRIADVSVNLDVNEGMEYLFERL